MIDVSNINVGLSVKGYKGMCVVIGDEYKGTNTKGITYQKKEWKRYFDWIEHTSRKWEITEVYEEVKEKEDGRRNNKGGANNVIYADHIDVMMLEYLSKHEYIDGTFKFFREQFGLRHDNYDRLYDEIPELAEELEIDVWYLWDFFAVTKRQSVGIVNSSLNRLVKIGCITYDKIKMAGCIGKDKHWELTPGEDDKLREIREWLLREMNAKSEQQIIYTGRWIDYKNELDIRVFKELGIDFMYNKYIVVCRSDKDALDSVDNMLGVFYDKYNVDDDQDEIDHFQAFNEKMCNKIIDNAIKRHDKALEIMKKQDGWGWFAQDEATERKSDKAYIDVYKRLVEQFIRVGNDEETINLTIGGNIIV